MDAIEKIRKEGVKINLIQTTDFLSNLYSGQNYKIESDYSTINTVNCFVKKGERCFEFNADEFIVIESPVKFQHKSYGYQDPFKLVNEFNSLIAYKGVGSIKLNLGNEFKSSGEIWELRSLSFNKGKSYYRSIIPISEFQKFPLHFIDSVGFNIGSSVRIRGYIPILIQEVKFGIYDYTIKGQDSLFIECYDKIDFEAFENKVSSIIYSFGLLSGDLFRNEIISLQYDDRKFSKITGFDFKRIEESISGMPAIDPELYWDLTKSDRISAYMKMTVYEKMVNNSLEDLRLFRAIKIMAESSNYPLEIKASTYSVALETVKNIIIEENETKLNPFKGKKRARETIKKLKSIVNDVPDAEFNEKSTVIKKLEQINQIGNKDSLLTSFKLLGIDLSTDDERCINMRNDFLHGRIPFNSEGENSYELQHIVYKLHLLVSSLILKYSCYSGLLINNIKLVDILHFQKNIDEPLFRRI